MGGICRANRIPVERHSVSPGRRRLAAYLVRAGNINWLALAQWEDEGKPINWSSRWNTDYRQEAAALANELLELLCDAESSGG
ncbi:hypothetical protein [Pseudomonas paracarnis]|uniref:hypothetical protein n=1 Tax=Pseudomonas paracarnis TaxID=2750625 RepID=UPI002164B337|nr:hypothetical protein [Pseudomonas paracarnis]